MRSKPRQASSGRCIWRKLSSAKWEDVWPERLSEWADRLAITVLPRAKTIRLEIFALTNRDAERLRRAFGGTVTARTRDWCRAPQPDRPPIRVRGKLVIVSKHAEKLDVRAGTPVLVIPAGMAFGTGEHATTLACLRFLADLAANHAGEDWEMLDLGCGSGILALAGRVLGARKVEAGDFDPVSVRIAKENAATNRLRGVRFRRLDVRAWEPDRTWPVITANLFSKLLAEIAPKLRNALKPDGQLVFSGILREQEQEVATAFAVAGLRVCRVVRNGKWVSGIARR